MLIAVVISVQAQTRIVEQPHATFANTRSLEIAKVTLSDTETVLDINAYFRPGYWIRVVSDSYLLANGKKYMIRSGEGIELDSLFWMPQSGEAEFKLTFEPIPKNTKSFDFIESDCEDCFKVYGIDLVNNRIQLPEIPKEFTQKHPVEIGYKAQLKKGDARVTGKIMGYVPTQEKFSLYYLNPITGLENNELITINNDGSFSSKITVYSPTQIFLTDRKLLRIPIRVAPGQESKVLVNFPEIYRAGSRLLVNEQPYGEQTYYSGYFAALNTDLADKRISNSIKGNHSDQVADMDVNEYKNFMMAKYEEDIAHNNKLGLSPLATQVVNNELTLALANSLSMGENALIGAYAQKYGVTYEEAVKKIKHEQPADDFNNFYELIPYDNTNLLLSQSFSYDINNLGYARSANMDQYAIIRFLSESSDVIPEDRQMIKTYLETLENGKEFEQMTEIGSVFEKYNTLAQTFLQEMMGESYLAKIWNTKSAVLIDIIKAQKIARLIQDFNPLTDEQKMGLADYSPVIRQALLEQNDDLLVRIEENKKKTGFTILTPPSNVDEKLFVDLLKPFKGKVILVDVWATWCGPCRAANKAMEPLKAQFADKDVVFLYLAGEDSPENTWKNMITDMKGQHYRVNQKQWDYLRESLNARGVPTYIIIDREGNHSFHTVGFPGPDTMKQELNKALSKK